MYIREAHPDSVLFVADEEGEKCLEKLAQTNTLEERSEAAKKCHRTLGLTIPALVDKEDNRVNDAYAAWPDRIIVVGKDGRIAYKGGLGPGGFKPEELEEWLKNNAR